jgi:aldehyde:ferredoxin oxidoreductase
MWFGWAGFDLEIDLSKGKVEKKERDPEFCKMYLGSRGVGSKILWDRVPADIGSRSTCWHISPRCKSYRFNNQISTDESGNIFEYGRVLGTGT